MDQLKTLIVPGARAGLVPRPSHALWGRLGVLLALVCTEAMPSRTRSFLRTGSLARRARFDRLRQFALGFFLSVSLGLFAPAAAEAMAGIESVEDSFHRAGARARLVRLEVPGARPARPILAASLRRPPSATKEPSGRPANGARVRKTPSTPDSPTALPDH